MTTQHKQDQASYWLEKAATALDCAVQCHGGPHASEIDKLEREADRLTKLVMMYERRTSSST